MYKVTKEDLVGQLEGFPLEVVQKMIEKQVEQGNEANVKIFQKDKFIGFTWSTAEEGYKFWSEVISEENFNLFFEKYPKQDTKEYEYYKVTKEDLICGIESLPLEVVQKMIERQVEQGNEADVSVFQKNRGSSVGVGGFRWNGTKEGDDFWVAVLSDERFDFFFEKYPKEEDLKFEVMEKCKIEEGSFYYYKDCFYKLLHKGQTKDTNSREWFDSVTYKQTASNLIFTRELQDFESKFKLVPFKV